MTKRILDKIEKNNVKRTKTVPESESHLSLVEVISNNEQLTEETWTENNEIEEDIIEEDEIIADAQIIEINQGAYYYEWAQWYLMPCKDTGESFAKQDPECMQYVYDLLHHAIELNYSFAYIKLAKLYEEGQGQFKNINKSIKLLEEALELKDSLVQKIAATQLGIFYAQGTEVDYDIEKAISCYKQAVDKGSEFAAYSLGQLYYQGKEVKKDLSKAREYLEKAAEQDYELALFSLYQLYKEINDRDKTINCLTRLIALGKDSYFASIAALELGYLYQDGSNTIKPDYKLAFDYFKQAAQLGEPLAQWEVAGKYLIKLIAEKDNLPELLEDYKFYLTQAAESGFRAALKELNAIEQCRMLAQQISTKKIPDKLFSPKDGIFLTQEKNTLQQENLIQQIHPIIIGTLGMIARLQKVTLAHVCSKTTILESLQQELTRVLERLPKETINTAVVIQISQAWLRKHKYFKQIPLTIKSGIFS